MHWFSSGLGRAQSIDIFDEPPESPGAIHTFFFLERKPPFME